MTPPSTGSMTSALQILASGERPDTLTLEQVRADQFCDDPPFGHGTVEVRWDGDNPVRYFRCGNRQTGVFWREDLVATSRERRPLLTTEQRAILEFMMPAMGEGLTLAHDIACQLGIPPRSCGQKLLALERRGLVRRAVAVKRASMKSDHLYGWELTGLGWEAAL